MTEKQRNREKDKQTNRQKERFIHHTLIDKWKKEREKKTNRQTDRKKDPSIKILTIGEREK